MLIHVEHRGEAQVFGPHPAGSFLSPRGRLGLTLLEGLAWRIFGDAIFATI